MLIKNAQLIGLSVETELGHALGKIDSFVLETESQTIYQYKIKPNGITQVFAKDLLISHEQVIDIKKNKMIVDADVYTEKEFTKAKSSPQVEPITSTIEK